MNSNPAPSRDWTLAALGVLTTAIGVYFALVGIDAAPPPGRVNGPVWLTFLVALVFFAGGVAVIVRGMTGGDNRSSELPFDTPRWVGVIYWLTTVMVATGLAGIGTWVAFGPGERQFSMSGPVAGPVGDTVGRIAFGIGAVITWLIVLVLVCQGARKFFGKKPDAPAA